MMRAQTQTVWLLAALFAVISLDATMWWLSQPDHTAEIPTLPPFDPARADTIRLGQVDSTIVLTRDPPGQWNIAPDALPADPVEIELLLSELADGVDGALAVQPEELTAYGLDGGAEIRVDVESAKTVLSTLYIGNDIGGGATWVRFPNDSRVLQARIGGRARYSRSISSLRDRHITEIDPVDVKAITLQSSDVILHATRANGQWQGDPFSVDSATIDELVRVIAGLRAIEVTDQDSGIDWDLAKVTLQTDANSVEMNFGKSETKRYVRQTERPGIALVRASWVDKLADPSTFGARLLWDLEQIDHFSLTAPGRDGLLDREGERFIIRRPAHVDVDPTQLAAVLSFLKQPRVIAWESSPPEFGREHLWTVQADGATFILEIGPTQGDRTAVRTAGRSGWLDTRSLRAVEALFGG